MEINYNVFKKIFNQVKVKTRSIIKKIKLLPFIQKIIILVSLSTILIVSISLAIIFSLETKKTSLSTKIPFIEKNNQNYTQPRITGAWEVDSKSKNTPTLEPTDRPLVRQKLDLGEISWLQFPQPIKLDIFNKTTINIDYSKYEEDCYQLNTIKLHKTGTFPDGSYLVNMYIDCQTMGERTELHRFIYTPIKQVYLLEEWKSYNQIFIPNILVKIADVAIKGLESPKEIILPNITINLSNFNNFRRNFYYSFTEIINPQKFFDSPYGPVYISYPTLEGFEPFVGRYFYLRHPDDTVSNYDTDVDFFSDNQIPKLTLIDGTENIDQYYTGLKSGGCGGLVNGYIKNEDLNQNDLIKIGTIIGNTSNYKDIYRINNHNNTIVKILFNDFKNYNLNDDKINSIEEYIKSPTHFLWQDNLGDWKVFGNEKYGGGAECAKPVIYLYPHFDTQVKVQVGAQITKSEPAYPEGGWLVTAKPNGELIYQNQNYPYLFWEGLGNGLYPDYRNRGIVAAQKDLVSTLYQQLSQLGLNQKESADFMEFWQPKLPSSPYVRLTWLNTKDMDTLAPLWVTPRPDTSIRIFLEFQGLDKPIKLIPQTLSAPARRGFTLIEWGGLLLKGRE